MCAISNAINSDIVREARRMIDAANDREILARATGGVAIALHATKPTPPALVRSYQDIDLVTTRKGGAATLKLLVDLGYQPNTRFNALNSATRLVVYDTYHGRHVDVFVGDFRMCHRLPLADRLSVDTYTPPLAELLLTKLQIVQLNEKDLKDIFAILVDHEIADHDRDAINATLIAKLLAGDWGLWRTAKETIATSRERVNDFALDPAQRCCIEQRLNNLWEVIDRTPKSRRWRVRARVGERARWYEEPEEIEHANQVHQLETFPGQ